jgi:hypothetical protein
MSANFPVPLLRYSALSDLRPRGVQSRLLTSKMSSQPSPSASKKAAPDPSVSGSHFFPARPLLCVNVMPEIAVTSVKVMPPGCATTTPIDRQTAANTATNRMNIPVTRFSCCRRSGLPPAAEVGLARS